jgi:2-polyprenyl-6-methoxyphenol hydroxylase-like FAD-dependent oxidoreductase
VRTGNRLRIRIVGGSLAGLFAAALLRMDGHDVTIYERSAGGLGGRGAGLVGQAEIFSILRIMGCERVATVGVMAKERVTLDRQGHIMQRQATPQMQISWDHLYATFRALVESEAYVLGRSVQRVKQTRDEARLEFSSGAGEVADLVIGADGLGSTVRESVMGRASPSDYAGYVAWRGLFSEHMLPAEAATTLLDRFAFYSMPGSHILGYLVAGPNGELTPGLRRYNWVWYRPIPPTDLVRTLTDRQDRAQPYSLAPGQLPEQRHRLLVEDVQRLLPPPFAQAVAAETQPFVQG